jgi:hypothetical protein
MYVFMCFYIKGIPILNVFICAKMYVQECAYIATEICVHLCLNVGAHTAVYLVLTGVSVSKLTAP